MTTKTVMPQTKKAAVKAMTNYIRKLAAKIPAGQKIAQVQANMAAERRLTKLANELARTGSIFSAVRASYPQKSAAYHYQVINGLVRGFTKQALGESNHPTAMLPGPTAADSGPAMATEQSATIPMGGKPSKSVPSQAALRARTACPGHRCQDHFLLLLPRVSELLLTSYAINTVGIDASECGQQQRSGERKPGMAFLLQRNQKPSGMLSGQDAGCKVGHEVALGHWVQLFSPPLTVAAGRAPASNVTHQVHQAAQHGDKRVGLHADLPGGTCVTQPLSVLCAGQRQIRHSPNVQ